MDQQTRFRQRKGGAVASASATAKNGPGATENGPSVTENGPGATENESPTAVPTTADRPGVASTTGSIIMPHLQPSPLVALLIVRVLVGTLLLPAIVTDCDEVFNYWEQAHYLEVGRPLGCASAVFVHIRAYRTHAECYEFMLYVSKSMLILCFTCQQIHAELMPNSCRIRVKYMPHMTRVEFMPNLKSITVRPRFTDMGVRAGVCSAKLALRADTSCMGRGCAWNGSDCWHFREGTDYWPCFNCMRGCQLMSIYIHDRSN